MLKTNTESKAAADAKQTVQTQFSHFYKVMGGSANEQNNALEMLQRKTPPTPGNGQQR